MFAQNFLSAQGSSCSNDGSMRKKARVEARLDAEPCPVAHELRNQAGQKLRMFLLDRFCMGTLPGSDVAELCYLITQSGGIGVADLALRPDRAVAHGPSGCCRSQLETAHLLEQGRSEHQCQQQRTLNLGRCGKMPPLPKEVKDAQGSRLIMAVHELVDLREVLARIEQVVISRNHADMGHEAVQ